MFSTAEKQVLDSQIKEMIRKQIEIDRLLKLNKVYQASNIELTAANQSLHDRLDDVVARELIALHTIESLKRKLNSSNSGGENDK